jgi:hypothetical protein
MNPRRLAALCGMVVFAGWGASGLLDFGWPRFGNNAASTLSSRATSPTVGAEPVDTPQAAMGEHGASVTSATIASAASSTVGPMPQPETPSAPVALANAERDVSVADGASAGADLPVVRPMPQPDTASAQIASVEVAPANSEHDVSVAHGASIGADLPVARPVPQPETVSAGVAPANSEHGASVTDGASVGADVPVAHPMPQPETSSAPVASANAEHDVVVTNGIVGADMPVARPMPQPETPSVQVASANASDPVQGDIKETVRSAETSEDCLVEEACIDRYLWLVYQRAPKVDTVKESEQIKVTAKKKGKTRTVSKTITKVVNEDFAWKDPKAADKAGMALMDYVIGGMDRSFKQKLYHALRALDEAGLSPGITSGFRDNYRQSLATGKKAATDSSYHGGSRRGGYGHGLAADLVSVKGETRAQRCSSSQDLWKWVDAHGKEFGIARPYLDRDPPHVGPLDGQEYADKRGLANARLAEMETKKRHASAASDNHSRAKRRRTASLKTRSI